MSKTANFYRNSVDHTWYDSSNIIYSECFDTQDNSKRAVKIVFKGGRTYLYKEVEPLDYVLFRDAQSNGQVFSTTIKQYPCEKLEDTDLAKLETLKQELTKSEEFEGEYSIHMKYNNETGEVKVYVNGEPRFEGVEGQISIINFMKAMSLQFTMEETDEHNSTSEDFLTRKICD